MATKENYEVQTEKLLSPITESKGFEIYDIEFVKEAGDYYLRAYIDKEGGINIDDCVEVSRELEKKLDEANFISEAYILEISSPGLGRQLKKEKHFMKSIGKDVDVKFFKETDGLKEFTGTLTDYCDGILTITVNDKIINTEAAKLAKICLHEDW